jgi:catechol 2,3-dioxygenase-like lactoylglutathione lyase family enzyme
MSAGGRIVGIQHVALPFPGGAVAVVDARRFYGEALGLTELTPPTEFGTNVIWFSAGGQELHLFVEPSGVAANSESHRHPCFQVDDLVALRQHLEVMKIETITAEPPLPGRPRFFVMDPFGNAIELLELFP